MFCTTYEISDSLSEFLQLLLQVEVLVGECLHHILCPQSSIHLTHKQREREGMKLTCRPVLITPYVCTYAPVPSVHQLMHQTPAKGRNTYYTRTYKLTLTRTREHTRTCTYKSHPLSKLQFILPSLHPPPPPTPLSYTRMHK